MANLKDVIYLSNEDYDTLISNGSVTIDGTTLTYDENNLYITPDRVATTSQNGLMSSSDKSKLNNVVMSVKVGSTSYSPSSGVVSLPAYPSDYLSLSGGTISNASLMPLAIYNTTANSGSAFIEYKNSQGSMGGLGMALGLASVRDTNGQVKALALSEDIPHVYKHDVYFSFYDDALVYTYYSTSNSSTTTANLDALLSKGAICPNAGPNADAYMFTIFSGRNSNSNSNDGTALKFICFYIMENSYYQSSGGYSISISSETITQM